MNFKSWLEATDTIFAQRERNQRKNIGNLLGFGVDLQKFSQGSFATLYYHPTNYNLLIKVTAHKEDVWNLYRSQRLESDNIVKVYDKPKEIFPKAWAITVEKINGTPMIYPTNDFISLITGSFNENLDDATTSILYATDDFTRRNILEKFNKLNDEECEKLSSLFRTLSELEKIGISMSDFSENILDAGDRYVIVDLGF
jgi:hypothetical protein